MTPTTTRSRSFLRRFGAVLSRRWRAVAERVFFYPWRVTATVADMDEVPVRIRRRRAFVVATETRRKWLVFDCPCDGGHRILLNLDRSRRPFWTVRMAKRGVFTLRPSVDYNDDRRSCHYFISEGRVEWAPAALESGLADTESENV